MLVTVKEAGGASVGAGSRCKLEFVGGGAPGYRGLQGGGGLMMCSGAASHHLNRRWWTGSEGTYVRGREAYVSDRSYLNAEEEVEVSVQSDSG
jgi:hypothetical protein